MPVAKLNITPALHYDIVKLAKGLENWPSTISDKRSALDSCTPV